MTLSAALVSSLKWLNALDYLLKPINLESIRSVESGVGARLHVQLNDGREVQISRRQARQFRERTTV